MERHLPRSQLRLLPRYITLHYITLHYIYLSSVRFYPSVTLRVPPTYPATASVAMVTPHLAT